MLMDFHCHLDLMDNMNSMISEISDSEISIIAVGTAPKAWKKEANLCSGNQNIHVACGLHPQLVGERFSELEMLLEFVPNTRYIGEIGLDFRSDYANYKDKQVYVFKKVLDVCSAYSSKVLSIHSVRSAGEVLKIIGDSGVSRRNTCILHWFTGSVQQMRKGADLDCYFSINPKMLKSKSGIDLISQMPKERILLETDAPFTFPVRNIIDYRNRLQEVVSGIHTIREDINEKIISDNSKSIVGVL